MFVCVIRVGGGGAGGGGGVGGGRVPVWPFCLSRALELFY